MTWPNIRTYRNFNSNREESFSKQGKWMVKSLTWVSLWSIWWESHPSRPNFSLTSASSTVLAIDSYLSLHLWLSIFACSYSFHYHWLSPNKYDLIFLPLFLELICWLLWNVCYYCYCYSPNKYVTNIWSDILAIVLPTNMLVALPHLYARTVHRLYQSATMLFSYLLLSYSLRMLLMIRKTILWK